MEKYLEYQKLDSELFKLEREISKNEHKRNAQQMVNFVKDAQSKIIDLDNMSKQTILDLEKLKQVQNKGISLVEKYSKQVVTANEAELKELKARIKQTSNQLTELENRLLSQEQKAKKLLQEFDNLKKKMSVAKTRHQDSKLKFDEYYASKEPELNEVKKKLVNMEKSLDSKFVAKYKNLKQDGIFPVLVPLVDKRCGGCRMELPSSEIEKVKQNGKLECPYCRRLIYFKD